MRHVSRIVLVSVMVSAVAVWAAPKPTVAVALAPTSPVAGSSDNTLTFSFTALERSEGEVVVVVPAPASGQPWSEPQGTNPLGPGFVDVQSMGCQLASLGSITGSAPGPWSVAVKHKCANNKSFIVGYRATAATRSGDYEFTTSVLVGRNYLPVAVQPLVTVVAGAAASLDLRGLESAPAGTVQTPLVTALDPFGNVATEYRGTVSFTSNDTQASLPAPHTFTAADAGAASFAGGVVLKTAGSRSVSVADTADGTLTDSRATTVSPGPTSQLVVSLAAQAIAFNTLSFGNCGVTPRDAYGNYTPDYTGTLRWTSSDSDAQLPVTGPWGQFNIYACAFHTDGSQQVAVFDDTNSLSGSGTITVLGPVAVADEMTVFNPIHPAGITRPAFSPMANDAFGVLASPTIASVGQATFTMAGVTRQLGVASVGPNGKQVILDMYPPAGTPAAVPGMELVRCAPLGESGGVCFVEVPITLDYTATDGINNTTASISLTMDTPQYLAFPLDLTLPSIPPYTGGAGFVPTDAPGFLIPLDVPLTVSNITTNSTTGITTMVLTGTLCSASEPGCAVTSFSTTATVSMPLGFAATGSVQGIMFNQSSSLITSSTGSVSGFSSIELAESPTAGSVGGVFVGSLLDITETQAFLGELLLPDPPLTQVETPNVVGLHLGVAAAQHSNAGLLPSSCVNPFTLIPTTIVTAQFPEAGALVPAGTVVELFYTGCSF